MNTEEVVESYIEKIENEINANSAFVSNKLINKTLSLCVFLNMQPDSIKEKVMHGLRGLALKSKPLVRVWLYSVMINYMRNAESVEEFLEYVIIEKEFGSNIKYFLYYQITAKVFSYKYLVNENIKYLCWKLLEQIVLSFKEEAIDLLDYIPYEQRNKDMVFVITEQILSKYHAPTKVAFDKCRFLIENMHKNILLINTAEMATKIGKIPFYDAFKGNYVDAYLSMPSLVWQGTLIPYFQCERNMPNISDLRELLLMIRNVKPGWVISIGGNSILANLVDNIIPVLTFGLSGGIQPSMTSCQTISENLNIEDIQLLNRMGISENTVIQSRPSVSMDIQVSVVTREEIGLPENKFIIFIAGNRLDYEIDDSFMSMLANTLDKDMAAAFVGEFKQYKRYMSKMPQLEGKVYNLGYAEDILAWLEVCDLYVNPYRAGGGTSAADALYKGVPVVTLPYGDVFVLTGEEFATESYDTMAGLIQKYKNDTEFYNKMSDYAKERGKALTDSPEDFQYIIDEFQIRMMDKEQYRQGKTV